MFGILTCWVFLPILKIFCFVFYPLWVIIEMLEGADTSYNSQSLIITGITYALFSSIESLQISKQYLFILLLVLVMGGYFLRNSEVLQRVLRKTTKPKMA